MISEWFVKLGTGLWAFFAGLFPDWEAPPELLDADGTLNQLFTLGQGLEPFANWALIGILAAIPLAVWVIGVMVRAVRLLIGHVPFVGGNG